MKNDVGNLAIVNDGAYVGFLDLRFGGVEWVIDNPDGIDTPL